MLVHAAVLEPDARPEPASLAARLRVADRAALAEVYDAHHVAVRALARRLTGDHAAAEDLVQDTFLALPRAIRGYRGDAPLRPFLLGVVINHARHHVRAAARRRAAMARHATHHALTSAEEAPPPDTQLAQQALAAALWRALDRLSLDHRVAFLLCEVEERPAAEAAALVGVPEATIRTRLFHARKKLRALMEATR
jgi:RNA polymerase sigma-70 factor (ECF subfamily)